MPGLLVCIALIVFVLAGSVSADEADVERIIRFQDPALRTQLLDFTKLAAMQRPVVEPSPTTVKEWEARRWEIRSRLMDSLGLSPLPPKTPLHPKVMGTLERADYRIEKVVLQSRPNFYVTGSLYIPKGHDLPAPTILYVHGHSLDAKAAEHYQTMHISFAKKGFVVFAIDGVGFGEREKEGHRCQASPLICGVSVLGLEIWDNIRAIDYLCTRPEVDEKRIGMTGCSGGGLQTTYMVAVDDRLSCAMPVDFVTTFRAFIGTGKVHCICNHLPNVMRYADCADLLSVFAPKPLMIGCGEFDHIFPVDGVRQTYSKVREIYRLYGAESMVGMYVSPTGHGYGQDKREAAYAWFNKWLENAADSREPSVELESRKTLCCFENGELPAGHESVNSLSLQQINRLATSRMKANENPDSLRKVIKEELFGGFPNPCPVEPKVRGRAENDEIRIERILFTSEQQIGTIPGLLILPKNAREKGPAVVYIDPKGKAEAAGSAEVHKFVRMGFKVLIPDLRGYGEMYDARCQYQGEDEYLAVTDSVFLGRHLMGMRVYDAIRCLDYLGERQEVDVSRVGIAGKGIGGLIALFAGALDKRFSWVMASDMLSSYVPDAAWFGGTTPWGPEWVGSYGYPPMVAFVPNIMKYADIPDIARLVDVPLLIDNPVDGLGRNLTSEQAVARFKGMASPDLLVTTKDSPEDGSAAWLNRRM